MLADLCIQGFVSKMLLVRGSPSQQQTSRCSCSRCKQGELGISTKLGLFVLSSNFFRTLLIIILCRRKLSSPVWNKCTNSKTSYDHGTHVQDASKENSVSVQNSVYSFY